MAKGLLKPIARSTHTRAGTLCLSRAPAATAPYCQRGGVYSEGGCERGGCVKSRWREDGRLGERIRLRQHDGGVAPCATRNTRSRVTGVRKATPRHHRSPPGGPILVASTAAVAPAGVTTAVPAVTAVTATTAGTFPRSSGDLSGTWRFLTSSTHCKVDARGPNCGA